MRAIYLLFSGFLLLPGIGLSQDVTIKGEESTDFSAYKTFSWSSGDSIPLALAALSPQEEYEAKVEDLDSRIRHSVEGHLVSKGFQKGERGDLIVNYTGMVRYRLDSGTQGKRSSGGNYGDWREPASRADSYLTKESVLTVEIIDFHTNRLLWKGSAVDTVKKPKDVAKKFDRMIKKMFRKFPR